jgi:hypothetical protein
MRRYALAMLAALVLVLGAYWMNNRVTAPPQPPIPFNPRDLKFH